MTANNKRQEGCDEAEKFSDSANANSKFTSRRIAIEDTNTN